MGVGRHGSELGRMANCSQRLLLGMQSLNQMALNNSLLSLLTPAGLYRCCQPNKTGPLPVHPLKILHAGGGWRGSAVLQSAGHRQQRPSIIIIGGVCVDPDVGKEKKAGKVHLVVGSARGGGVG